MLLALHLTIIPRFPLDGINAGLLANVFKLGTQTGERLVLLATEIVGEGDWMDLGEPITVRDAVIAAPKITFKLETRRPAA